MSQASTQTLRILIDALDRSGPGVQSASGNLQKLDRVAKETFSNLDKPISMRQLRDFALGPMQFAVALEGMKGGIAALHGVGAAFDLANASAQGGAIAIAAAKDQLAGFAGGIPIVGGLVSEFIKLGAEIAGVDDRAKAAQASIKAMTALTDLAALAEEKLRQARYGPATARQTALRDLDAIYRQAAKGEEEADAAMKPSFLHAAWIGLKDMIGDAMIGGYKGNDEDSGQARARALRELSNAAAPAINAGRERVNLEWAKEDLAAAQRRFAPGTPGTPEAVEIAYERSARMFGAPHAADAERADRLIKAAEAQQAASEAILHRLEQGAIVTTGDIGAGN